MTNITARQLYGEFSELGIEVLSVDQNRRSTHVKVRCQYRGHKFTYVTSLNRSEADHGKANMLADLKRIQRAIRMGQLSILSKYKVQRDDPGTV